MSVVTPGGVGPKFAPRPAVPGEETHVISMDEPATHQGGNSVVESSCGLSPAMTPRKFGVVDSKNGTEGELFLGFDPEGSCSATPPVMKSSPPPYLQWAETLRNLLEDGDGVQLFQKYVHQEKCEKLLNFWLACEGLKKQPEDSQQLLIRAIYRRYIVKSKDILQISERTRKEITDVISLREKLHRSIYDKAQEEVESVMARSIYLNFLKSDVYLHYVQEQQGTESPKCVSDDNGSGSSSPGDSSSSGAGERGAVGILPPLPEETELPLNETKSALPLTKESLMKTERRRIQAKAIPEAFAGRYLHSSPYPPNPYHYHNKYSSYLPVSRQDSERQSLSSGALTDDTRSLTDNNSVESRYLSRAERRQQKQFFKYMLDNAAPNEDMSVIPRTQRIDHEKVKPMEPEKFAKILISKLEKLKESQDAKEKLNQCLHETDEWNPMKSEHVTQQQVVSSLVCAMKKMRTDEDNGQSILDDHVSHVWPDSCSHTPSMSGGHTPPENKKGADSKKGLVPTGPDLKKRCGPPIPVKPELPAGTIPRLVKNPDGSRTFVDPRPGGMPLHAPARISSHHRRREKMDVFSTFSSDSGNVQDYSEASDYRHQIPKSKSMPDYAEMRLSGSDTVRRSKDLSRHLANKKTSVDLTDSGVSVVSDTVPHVPSVGPTSENRTKKGHMHPSSSRPLPQDRTGYIVGPKQPFISDPSMPPLPWPDTDSQLEEARRRLEHESRKSWKARTASQTLRPQQPGDHVPSTSACSTLRKMTQNPHSIAGSVAGSDSTLVSDHTVIMYSYCDEKLPYRTKLPGKNITLRQFKALIPKRGNSYRFYFRNLCEGLAVMNEVEDEDEFLPIFDGKVIAQVKAVE